MNKMVWLTRKFFCLYLKLLENLSSIFNISQTHTEYKEGWGKL